MCVSIAYIDEAFYEGVLFQLSYILLSISVSLCVCVPLLLCVFSLVDEFIYCAWLFLCFVCVS